MAKTSSKSKLLRAEQEGDEEEEYDPFNYKPLKKTRISKKRKSPSAATAAKPSKIKKKSPTLTSPLKFTETPPPRPQTSRGDPSSSSCQHCRFCQMPFGILARFTSPSTHETLCIETMNPGSLPPCPGGIRCDVTIESHYTKFNHLALAAHREHGDRPWACDGDNEASEDSIRTHLPEAESTRIGEKEKSRPSATQAFDLGESFFPDDNHNVVDMTETLLGEHERDPEPPPNNKTSASAHTQSRKVGKKSSTCAEKSAFMSLFERSPSKSPAKSKESTPTKTSLANSEAHSPPAPLVLETPARISADVDSDELNIRITVDPDAQVDLRAMNLKISTRNPKSPVQVESTVAPKVPVSEARNIFASIMKNNKSRKEDKRNGGGDGKEISSSSSSSNNRDVTLERAKKNGFLAPGTSNNSGGGYGSNGYGKRDCPFYKKIPGTCFTVDAFNYGKVPGITKYFLSHFHYDHYQGLTKHFSDGIIICSEITARLLNLKIHPDPNRIRALPLDEAVTIDDVEVTLLDANHCPGAVMFLFKFISGKCVLHVGDFRAVPAMESYPALWNNKIDSVYLDTTYCKEEYDFPSQADVVEATCDLVKRHLERHPKTLICVGSYTIGKERIFTALAERYDFKIWAGTEKTRILRTLRDPVIDARLVTTPHLAQLHVMEMKRLRNSRELQQYLYNLNGKYKHVLTIKPTGWTHCQGASAETSLKSLRIKPSLGGEVSFLEVPYSEHSSYSEMRRFVQFLNLSDPKKIIPTVNVGSPAQRGQMQRLFKEWLSTSPSGKKNNITNYFTT